MRVFDVPKGYGPGDGQLRIAVHGTCRVHDPFESLYAAGHVVKVWANNLAVSYTVGEALQMLQYCKGDRTIADPLLPFIFHEPSQLPRQEPSHRRILENADAFVFELCELRQVRYRDVFFQIQSFTQNFITRHGSAILPWYRAFSLGQPVSAELANDALAKLPNLTVEERELTDSILRETRLEVVDVEFLKRAILELTADSPSKWTFVSHFMVPGVSGTMMQDRAKARAILQEATAACGVGFFDPSEIVALHGRETALDKKGADIYHYDPAFQVTAGQALLKQPRQRSIDSGRSAGRVRPVRPAVENAPLEIVGGALNAVLISLHRQRVAQLGVNASGLYEHYAALLEQQQIVRKSETSIADVILHYLPSFDCYHVLRAGLGEMAFLLAAWGCKTVAFDPFGPRFSAIEAGWVHLQSCQFPLADGFGAIQEVVPDVGSEGRTLAVANQMMFTVSAEEEDVLLAQLEKYAAILFNPKGLFRTRDGSGEDEALIDRFRRSGFTHLRDYPHLGLVYCAKSDAGTSSR